MAYVQTVPEETATGDVATLYEEERERFGFVPNLVTVFSQRPDAYRAWRGLVDAILATSDFRRYELATLAAARELRSSYCTLAHSKVLSERFYDAEAVVALPEGLDEADTAIMEVAAKVAGDASTVSQADVDRLRSLGLDDGEIVDVMLAAAARSFFSKMLEALGAEPDAVYATLDPRLRESA
jgi:uncharacterized peroxidase-related enzyme